MSFTDMFGGAATLALSQPYLIAVLIFAIVVAAIIDRRLSVILVVGMAVAMITLHAWQTFFPADDGNHAEGAATIIAAILTVIVAAYAGLAEYRRNQADASITVVAQLTNEIIGFVEEIDDIAYGFKTLGWKKITDPYKDPFEIEQIDSLERVDGLLGKRFGRYFASLNDDRARLPENRAHFASAGDNDQDRESYPKTIEELDALSLKLEATHYEQTIRELRSLKDRAYWQDALVSIGEFYERREYVKSLLDRAKDLQPLVHGARATPEQQLRWGDEYNRLIYYYLINLDDLNLLRGPLTIANMLLALSRGVNVQTRKSLALTAERIRRRYELNREILARKKQHRLDQAARQRQAASEATDQPQPAS